MKNRGNMGHQCDTCSKGWEFYNDCGQCHCGWTDIEPCEKHVCASNYDWLMHLDVTDLVSWLVKQDYICPDVTPHDWTFLSDAKKAHAWFTYLNNKHDFMP